MWETDYEKLRRDSRELEGKNVAFYQVLLAAWVQTRMEYSRTIIVLSAGGIGLLTAILTMSAVHGRLRLMAIAGAFFGFFLSLLLGLRTYERNADHLMSSLKGGPDRDLKLEGYDRWSKRMFVLGSACLIVLGLISVVRIFPRGMHLSRQEGVLVTHEIKENSSGTVSSASQNLNSTVSTKPLEASKSGSVAVQPVVASQGTSKSSVAASTSSEVPQKRGNGGFFQRGQLR